MEVTKQTEKVPPPSHYGSTNEVMCDFHTPMQPNLNQPPTPAVCSGCGGAGESGAALNLCASCRFAYNNTSIIATLTERTRPKQVPQGVHKEHGSNSKAPKTPEKVDTSGSVDEQMLPGRDRSGNIRSDDDDQGDREHIHDLSR